MTDKNEVIQKMPEIYSEEKIDNDSKQASYNSSYMSDLDSQ